MNQFSSVQVQAFVVYLLKLRKWCVKMLTTASRENHIHFPIQAAVEGMIGWGKLSSTMF